MGAHFNSPPFSRHMPVARESEEIENRYRLLTLDKKHNRYKESEGKPLSDTNLSRDLYNIK